MFIECHCLRCGAWFRKEQMVAKDGHKDCCPVCYNFGVDARIEENEKEERRR